MTGIPAPLLDDPSDLSALRAAGTDPDELFASFAAWAQANGTVLYPAQEEALIELVSGANVVLATPTGSGKSLVATGALYAALAAGGAATTPRRSRHWSARSSSPCAGYSARPTSGC